MAEPWWESRPGEAAAESRTADADATPGGNARLPLVLGGVFIAVVGVAAALVLWTIAEGRHDGVIAAFARAPAGCDTTLSFEADGRYVIYVETAGRLDGIAGDCPASGTYVRAEGSMPPFEVAIFGSDGDRLSLGGHNGIAYDSDGFIGESVGSVEIDRVGEYVMRVASPADDFVVAVGTDPGDDTAVLRLAAISVLVAGLVVGGTALVMAWTRRAGDDRDESSGTDGRVVTATWPADGPTTGVWDAAARPTLGGPTIPGEALHPPAAPPSPSDTSPWAPPRREVSPADRGGQGVDQ